MCYTVKGRNYDGKLKLVDDQISSLGYEAKTKKKKILSKSTKIKFLAKL